MALDSYEKSLNHTSRKDAPANSWVKSLENFNFLPNIGSANVTFLT
jgi:hypothetical protein